MADGDRYADARQPSGEGVITTRTSGDVAARSAATKRFTLVSRPRKPWSSTRLSQRAVALRRCPSASSIKIRQGSHPPVDGVRVRGGSAAGGVGGSVDATDEMTGLAIRSLGRSRERHQVHEPAVHHHPAARHRAARDAQVLVEAVAMHRRAHRRAPRRHAVEHVEAGPLAADDSRADVERIRGCGDGALDGAGPANDEARSTRETGDAATIEERELLASRLGTRPDRRPDRSRDGRSLRAMLACVLV